jgi:ABC-type nitrate/sulfonate/bicarbonate transport system ATPase subunit
LPGAVDGAKVLLLLVTLQLDADPRRAKLQDEQIVANTHNTVVMVHDVDEAVL